MNLPIIQSLWIGNKLSLNEILCIKSFVYHKHEFHLYVYENIENVPEGTILKNANEIIPKSKIFKYGHDKSSYAGFSDWFRYKLLYEKGGFWVDTDVICLKPFDFKEEIIFGSQDDQYICNAVLGFPEKHDLINFMVNLCENPNKFLPYDSFKDLKRKIRRLILRKGNEHLFWGEAGPDGLTKALKYHKLINHAKPIECFYPISWENWSHIYDSNTKNDLKNYENSYCIHLWNEMSRRNKFDKNSMFEKNSLIEILREKYL